MELALFPQDLESIAAIMASSSDGKGDRTFASGQQDATATPLAGKSALVVEDEYIVGLEMAQTLKSWGLSVTGPLQTLKDAESAGDSSQWSCAILDVNLDGTDTLDLARRLRARGITVVFVTAYASNDARFAGDLSAIPRLGKPIPYRTLRRIITDALS